MVLELSPVCISGFFLFLLLMAPFVLRRACPTEVEREIKKSAYADTLFLFLSSFQPLICESVRYFFLVFFFSFTPIRFCFV